MKIFKKLIRDRVPEILKSEGKSPQIRIITDDKEYIEALERKLIEEIQEMRQGDDPQEKIAYIYEILETLIHARGFSKEEILMSQEKQRQEKGGFQKRLFLEGVE